MAILQQSTGSARGEVYRIDGDACLLGRHPDCQIYEVFLDANAVSRRHARVVRQDRQFFVEDLNSRNGTLLNGERIARRELLHDADRISICDVEFLFFHGERPKTPDEMSLGTSSFAGALLIDDDDHTTSSIMSRVKVSSSSGFSGPHLVTNAESKLQALIEMLGNLGPSLKLDDVLDNLLTGLFKIFVQADRGFIGLKLPNDGPVVPRAVKHRRVGQDDTVRVSRTIVNQVIESKRAILSADASSDSRFDMAQSIADFQIRSMMCAPLLDSDDNALGVIQIDTLNQRSRFQHEDLEVLASIAPQAAFALQFAQLHESALRQQALERDMQLAHKVQRGLLPSSRPEVAGYHFFDFYEPAYQVGGDYYDYILLGDGRLGVVVADVSGKGVSAALMMASLAGELKFCLASEPTPSKAIDRVNALADRAGWEDRFVTLALLVLDPRTHEVTLVNAGHMAPLLRHADGRVEAVGEESNGFPLGVVSDAKYESFHLKLAPGDSLTMFTDGFSEAMSAGGQFYGLPRLEKQIASPVDDIAQLGQHILDDVQRFVRSHPQSDDMCLTCFGRDAELTNDE